MKLAGDIINDVPFVMQGEYATKARQILRDDIYREIYVLNAGKKPVGYIDITDVLRIADTRSNVTIDGFMKEAPTAQMGDTLEDVAKKIRGYATDSCAVIQDDGTYAGAVLLSNLFPVLAGRATIRGCVRDVMTKKVVTASPEESIQKAYSLIVESGFAGIPVLRKKELIGIVSRRDLLSGSVRSALNSGTAMPVEKVMRTAVVTIDENASVTEAAKKMVDADVSRIPVMQGKTLVGIIDRFDVLKNII